MRFLEIADGVSVCIADIEAVSKRDAMMSTVYTHHNSYDSTFPYDVILQLINNALQEQNQEQNNSNKEIDRQQYNILKQSGYFAG